jgi:diaminopimelate epimerase
VEFTPTVGDFCFSVCVLYGRFALFIMKIPFTKMHGAGNDFIVVDDRTCRSFPMEDKAFIRRICSRHIGVGCDGILLLQASESADIRMRFINPDGGEQDMCGNGARCIARFAHDRDLAPPKMTIETGAGLVHAEVAEGEVRLELPDSSDLRLDVPVGMDWTVDFVNTGVPHAVAWVEDPRTVDLLSAGSALRYHAFFEPDGTNADFARVEPDGTLALRTYERGVEAETQACGTGAAAAAVLAAERRWVKLPVTVHCIGGHDLVINRICGRTTLAGGAEGVFDGEIEYGNRV